MSSSGGYSASFLLQAEVVVFFLFALITRVKLIAIINEVAITDLLGHELVQTAEILFTKICPKLLVICRDQIVVGNVTLCQLSGHLLDWSTVELLDLLDLLLELGNHLIDLGRLHIKVIDMVPLDNMVASLLPVPLVQVVEVQVPLPELLYHELL